MRKLLAIILAAGFVGVHAQQRLSLTEAQEYALSNNLTVRNTNLDLEKAKKKIWETAADGLPQISASGNYQHMLSSIPELDLSSMSGGQPAQPGAPTKVSLGVLNNYTGSATLNQLIFNGSYIVGLQATKVYKSLAELGVEKSIIEIRAAVTQGYYMCQMAEEMTGILKENLDLLEKTITEMRAMKEQGFVDRTSLDQLEVTFNQITAQYNSACRQVKNSKDMLKYIMGMPMSTEIVLSDDLGSIMSEVSDDFTKVQSYSQDDHIDIKLAETDVVVNKMMLKLAKSAYLPTLGAQLGVNHNFTMPAFSFQNATTAYFGAALNVPLFTSGKTHAQVRQAKFSLEQAENRETLARQSLDLEFQQATDAFQLAWDNYLVQTKNVALAARVLDDMKKSITVGMKSSTDLIQANGGYLQAVSELVSSQLNLLNSKTRIDKILNK